MCRVPGDLVTKMLPEPPLQEQGGLEGFLGLAGQGKLPRGAVLRTGIPGVRREEERIPGKAGHLPGPPSPTPQSEIWKDTGGSGEWKPRFNPPAAPSSHPLFPDPGILPPPVTDAALALSSQQLASELIACFQPTPGDTWGNSQPLRLRPCTVRGLA